MKVSRFASLIFVLAFTGPLAFASGLGVSTRTDVTWAPGLNAFTGQVRASAEASTTFDNTLSLDGFDGAPIRLGALNGDRLVVSQGLVLSSGRGLLGIGLRLGNVVPTQEVIQRDVALDDSDFYRTAWFPQGANRDWGTVSGYASIGTTIPFGSRVVLSPRLLGDVSLNMNRILGRRPSVVETIRSRPGAGSGLSVRSRPESQPYLVYGGAVQLDVIISTPVGSIVLGAGATYVIAPNIPLLYGETLSLMGWMPLATIGWESAR